MGLGKYFLVLIISLLNFLVLLRLVFNLPSAKLEIVLSCIFMVLAFIMVIGFYNDAGWAAWLGIVLFALNLLNVLYLYFRISSSLLIWYTIIAAAGFIVSIKSIKNEEEEMEELKEKRTEIEKQLGRLDTETPQIEIIRDDYPPAKKQKKSKKKSSKK